MTTVRAVTRIGVIDVFPGNHLADIFESRDVRRRNDQCPAWLEYSSDFEQSVDRIRQQVFKNLTAVLEASGSSVEHIVKATVFLADMNDYNAMNELYRKQFKGDPPARTTVQVAKLPRDARIEIEAVAVLK